MITLPKVFAAAVLIFTSVQATAAETATWTEKQALPVGVAEVGVTELDGKIYVVGGTEQNAAGTLIWASKLTLMYDPTLDKWKEVAPLPMGLTHVGLTSFGGKLYAVGGFTSPVHLDPQNIALVYDPKSNEWAKIADLPQGLGSVGVVAVDGKIHVFGGRRNDKVIKLPAPAGVPEMFAGFGTVTSHEIFDPKTGRWSKGAPMPTPARDHMGIAVLNGKVHIFGGRVADIVDNLDRHDVYDPISDKWSVAAPLPKPRSSGAYTVLAGKLIYAGGECKPGGEPGTANVFEDVTAYDPATDSWAVLEDLPKAHHAFGAATIGEVAYFVGGAELCGGGTSTSVMALSLH